MFELSILAERGKLRPLSAAELATVPGELRPIYDALKVASQEMEAAEAKHVAETESLHVLVRESNEARTALEKIRPPKTFLDCWRENIAAQSRR